MIEIIKKGMLATVQDGGRFGYQQFGMQVAGAMDQFALSLANILVGNEQSTEAIEATIIGPTIAFHEANIFAICGADMSPQLNGQPIENNRAYVANKGDELRMAIAKKGARAYIAFSGGLVADLVMGSRSTYVKGKIGGKDGRALTDGDTLEFRAPATQLPNLPFRYVGQLGPCYNANPTIRVILGPQDDMFTKAGIETFLSGEYEVTQENDRMGYRLSGPPVEAAEGCDGNIISDGICMGAVQIPGDQPIVMMADRQTTGGYAKIANVISADLPLLAQLKAGDKLRFAKIGVAEAQAIYRERYDMLAELDRHFREDEIIRKVKQSATVNGETYDVIIEEMK